MLRAACMALGLAAVVCGGDARALVLDDAKDAFADTLQRTRELASRRFEHRTGGDEQFIEAAREALRGTYDAIRDIARVNCAGAPVASETGNPMPADVADAIKDCEIAKADASYELLNRAAHMWQGFKPNYGAIELLMRVRSDVRRFIRLVEDDGMLYEDTGPWPSPQPAFDADKGRVGGASPTAARQIETMQTELLRQGQAIEAMMAVAAQHGLVLDPNAAVPRTGQRFPVEGPRPLPQPGGNR
jgi:hypothetical protein